MKAKNLFKKSLAWMLTLVLIVLAVPMAAFVASAEATAAPTPDATDIGGKLVVVTTEALYNDFADDGVFTLGRTQGARFMDPVFGAGVVYASAKFKMNGNVHYNWNANAETGEYAYAGNYNNLGFDLGTATLGDGTSFVLHLSYRRNQGIYIMADSSCSKFVKTSGATKNLDELVLTVKYDPATYTFSIWENGVQKGDISYADQVDPAATDASKIKTITMNHFGIHNSDLGFTAENPEDVTNGNKTENTVTVSDVHLWGDVTAGKAATKAPTAGANSTDITANVTLSDAAMNADWKEDGKFAWAVAQNQYYTFDGIDFTKGNNKIVYATATFTNRANGGDGNGIYGTVFTSAGDYNYLRPAWQQQGLAKYNAEQLIGNVVPEGDGTFAGNVWKVTYKWDVDNDTVDIWLTTQFHQGKYNVPQGYGFLATFYVGRFYLKNCAPQFGLRTKPVAEQLSGTVNVQDVRVWEETAAATEGGSTTNVATSANAWVGGTLNDNLQNTGAAANVLTTMPTFTQGSTLATGDTFVTTQSAGLYSMPHAMVWAGLKGDLSKGSITYEGDVTLFTSTSSTRLLGFIPCTVNGHYVSMGLGFHYSADGYYPKTLINMGTDDNARNATGTLLGNTWNQNISGVANVVGTDTGTTAHIKYVLTKDSLAFYVNGKLAQFANLEGKTVVPTFMFGWASGNENDYLSNVKIYGDGVEACSHTFDGCTDTTCDDCGYIRADGAHEYDDANDAFCNICNAERVLFTVLFKDGMLNADYATHIKGATVPAALTLAPTEFAVQSLVLSGAEFDLSKGSYTLSADFKVTTNTSMESHFGITAVVMNGDIYTFGLLSNGNWNTPDGNQTYTPYVRKNHDNTLVGATGDSVTATDAGATINLKVVVSATSAVYYVNGKAAYTLDMSAADSVAPFTAFTSRGANVEVSNIKLDGAAAFNCRHEYDNDADEDCNKCGTVRVAPGKVLPTIGENTNFAGDLVFENAGVNAEYAENGTITTSGLNGKANGVLLGENGVAYIKTDITFNGNVDWNWVEQKDAETGEGLGTYAYKEAWGRTGVQIGTYYSTGRERRMSVYVTYRRCTGGVYVWDNAQEVNGSENPVVVGNIAADLAALSLVVRYDSVANNVTVWADGAYVGTVSLEAFGEFAFALGVTQYGSGTTAVDPSDNTNPETTANNVTFANFEVWGDLTADNTILRGYTDANGNKVVVERVEGDDVYVKVIPAEGYVVEAGSLKLGDRNIINGVGETVDGFSGNGLTFVVSKAEIQNLKLSAKFVSKNTTSVSAAIIGTQVHTNDDGTVDGVRKLNRIYIDGITRENLQTANALTVKYNGETYTVADYGIIAGRAMANPEELSLTNYWNKASGIDNYIHSYSDNYIDISATIKTKFPDRKYSVRGYITLSNGTTIYTDVETFCINDFANAQ